jgi:hypothetical protein
MPREGFFIIPGGVGPQVVVRIKDGVAHPYRFHNRGVMGFVVGGVQISTGNSADVATDSDEILINDPGTGNYAIGVFESL